MHPFKYVSFKEFWLCLNWATPHSGKPTKDFHNLFLEKYSISSTPACMFLAYSRSSTIFMGGKKMYIFYFLERWMEVLNEILRGDNLVEREALVLETSSRLCGPCSSTDFTVWPWTNGLTSLCLSVSRSKMEIMIPTIAYLIGMLWGQMR